jgi:hypothetical protein
MVFKFDGPAFIIDPKTGEQIPIKVTASEVLPLAVNAPEIDVDALNESLDALRSGVKVTFSVEDTESQSFFDAIWERGEEYRRKWERWLDAVFRNWRN